MTIDCHGHYTTAPRALDDWRNRLIAGIKDPALSPKAAELKIGDDDLRETIEANQLRLMKQRGSDLTIFSPRASFMAHHSGDFQVSSTWAAICNELCYRVSRLFPDHFIPAAMLPQSPGVDPASCIPELKRCVEEYGNVGINLNPDPSGGHWNSPPLPDRHWYPIYEKMVELEIPAMVHVSTSCNACFHTLLVHLLDVSIEHGVLNGQSRLIGKKAQEVKVLFCDGVLIVKIVDEDDPDHFAFSPERNRGKGTNKGISAELVSDHTSEAGMQLASSAARSFRGFFVHGGELDVKRFPLGHGARKDTFIQGQGDPLPLDP